MFNNDVFGIVNEFNYLIMVLNFDGNFLKHKNMNQSTGKKSFVFDTHWFKKKPIFQCRNTVSVLIHISLVYFNTHQKFGVGIKPSMYKKSMFNFVGKFRCGTKGRD